MSTHLSNLNQTSLAAFPPYFLNLISNFFPHINQKKLLKRKEREIKSHSGTTKNEGRVSKQAEKKIKKKYNKRAGS